MISVSLLLEHLLPRACRFNLPCDLNRFRPSFYYHYRELDHSVVRSRDSTTSVSGTLAMHQVIPIPRSNYNYRQCRSKSTNHDQQPISNRAAFQSLPVIPSILRHIEKIGVGIRSKPSLLRGRRSGANNKRNSQSTSDAILNATEEVEFFANREREHNVHWRDRRNEKTQAAAGKKKKRNPLKETKESTESIGSYWLPPPPFSSSTKSDADENNHNTKIIRRPVKCLGRAGSLGDKLPLESKGLSEIAIIGRSNVGKSTVLNALLYGNTDEALSPRKFQRGRTPQGAKLPKGVKAITSHKPGETKELSFYQITADFIVQSTNDAIGESTSKTNAEKNEQMKMSLLMVDLPGYGFAYAKEERTKEWQELMHHYLLERKSLKRILLLLDARHGFKQTDFDFLGDLQNGLLEKNIERRVSPSGH